MYQYSMILINDPIIPRMEILVLCLLYTYTLASFTHVFLKERKNIHFPIFSNIFRYMICMYTYTHVSGNFFPHQLICHHPKFQFHLVSINVVFFLPYSASRRGNKQNAARANRSRENGKYWFVSDSRQFRLPGDAW